MNNNVIVCNSKEENIPHHKNVWPKENNNTHNLPTEYQVGKIIFEINKIIKLYLCLEMSMTFLVYLLLLVSLEIENEGNNGQSKSSHIYNNSELYCTKVVRQGKERLQEYESRVSPCWMNVFEELQSKCNEMTDIGRRNLTMKLANCHFKIPGLKTYDSTSEGKFQQSIPRIKTIDNSSFLAYTEFFNQVTDKLCFHLRSETWRQKPAKIIALMSKITEDTIAKLDHSLSIQETVLYNHNKLLLIQEENMEHAKNVKNTLPYFKNTSEYMAFYIVVFAVCYLVTSIPIIIKARPYIFIIFALLALIGKILAEKEFTNEDIIGYKMVFGLPFLFTS